MKLRAVATVVAVLVASSSGIARAANDHWVPFPYDCDAPPEEAEWGTPQWEDRNEANSACKTQGNFDWTTNPAARAAWVEMEADPRLHLFYREGRFMEPDPLRFPPLRWDTTQALDPMIDALRPVHRGHWRFVTYTGTYDDNSGLPHVLPHGVNDTIPGQIFAPLDECTEGQADQCPAGVPTHPAPPYPAVYIQPGLVSTANQFAFIAETLAEHGYVVLSSGWGPETSQSWVSTARAGLDFLLATPDSPNAHGEFNPFWAVTDGSRVGFAGYSNPSMQAVGMSDDRVDAVVELGAYSRTPRFRSKPILQLNEEDTGGCLIYSCLPPASRLPGGDAESSAPPDPDANGVRDIRDGGSTGADIMVVTPRASSHLGYGQVSFGGTQPVFESSRYQQQIGNYYTLAWFDRYVRHTDDPFGPGAREAVGRLTARVHDDSVDVSSIGTGTYDPDKALAAGDVYAGNEPIMLAGAEVANRLSFSYRSGYVLDDGALTCFDLRVGCLP